MSKHARLESNITRALTGILRESVKNPDIGFITITAVKLTNDLSYLTVYYTVLDESDESRQKTAQALERSKAFIRTSLAQQVNMRKSPQLVFKYDVSLDTGNRIEKGLKEVL